MKIALLPGHARQKDGACVCAGYYQNFGEWALARAYLPAMAARLRELGFSVELTQREDAGGVTPSYSAKAANATGADIALEWHFNSSIKPTVRGCEVLYWHASATGKRFATRLSAALAELLGVPDRGAKPISSPADRGFEAFRRSRMPYFMVEPCFAGSNAQDAEVLSRLVRSGEFARRGAGAVAAAAEQTYRKADNAAP